MIFSTIGTTRRATRLPRFLHLDWVIWVLGIALGSAGDMVLALLSITSIMLIAPDFGTSLGVDTIPIITERAIIGLGIDPAFIAVIPACYLMMSALSFLWEKGDQAHTLDPAQIAIFRRAAIYGWIVEFRGDGRYDLYGPDSQRESFGDLADLDWFVTDVENQHDHDAPEEPVDHRQPGLGGESGAVSALDRG